jgi:hypothetical protein
LRVGKSIARTGISANMAIAPMISRHHTSSESKAPEMSTVTSIPTDQNASAKFSYRPGSLECKPWTKGVACPSITPSPVPGISRARKTISYEEATAHNPIPILAIMIVHPSPRRLPTRPATNPPINIATTKGTVRPIWRVPPALMPPSSREQFRTGNAHPMYLQRQAVVGQEIRD